MLGSELIPCHCQMTLRAQPVLLAAGLPSWPSVPTPLPLLLVPRLMMMSQGILRAERRRALLPQWVMQSPTLLLPRHPSGPGRLRLGSYS